jgi:hypothetical protein
MLVSTDNTVRKTVSGAAVKPGHFLETDCGRIGVVVGAGEVAVGEKATLATKGRVRIKAGATLAVGDVASIKPSTQTALAADAADSVNAGLVVLGASSGGYVEIDLGDFPYTTPAE